LNPIFVSHLRIPNVVMVPIADTGAIWDLFVSWQRGRTSGPLRALLDALTLKSGRSVRRAFVYMYLGCTDASP
jgi:hypothetical protein